MDLNEKYTFFVVMLVLRIIYFFCYIFTIKKRLLVYLFALVY